MRFLKAVGVAGLILTSCQIANVLAQTGPGDAAAGKSMYPLCTSCHGVNGSGSQAMGAPKISGQLAFYTLKQLQHFQNGLRGTVAGDMKGMQMAAMSKGVTAKVA